MTCPSGLKILVIETSTQQFDDTLSVLQSIGFDVERACDCRHAFVKILDHAYAAILVMSLNLSLDVRTVISAMRQMGVVTPIMTLSDSSDVYDQIEVLPHGADATLGQPFDTEELSATIEALIRRRVRRSSPDTSLRAPEIELNLANRSAIHGGRVIHLRHTAFRLLEYMMRNQGRVLTRIEILEGVWGEWPHSDRNPVDQQVCLLRKTIDLPGKASRIRCVRRVGYQFL